MYIFNSSECWPRHEVVCVGTAVSNLSLPFTGDRVRPSGYRGVNHVWVRRLEGQLRKWEAAWCSWVEGKQQPAVSINLCATLSRGNRCRKWGPGGAAMRHHCLILCPRACVNGSKKGTSNVMKGWRNPSGRQAEWAGPSWPLTSLHTCWRGH